MGTLRADRITGLGGADAIKGSVFFGGGGGLVSPESDDFKFCAGGDFTIEAWVNTFEFGNAAAIVACWDQTGADGSGEGGDCWLLNINTSGVLQLAWSPHATDVYFITGGTLTKDTWHHVAVTRNGNTFRIFLDGTQTATGTNSSTNNTNSELFIGRYGGYGLDYYWHGNISNVRILKGEALYTSTFTPPNRELTVTPNTVLVACQSPGNISQEATGKHLSIIKKNVNDAPPVASSFTPNSPVGFSTTTDVGSQYGSTFDGFGSFATSTYMVPPGGNTRERGRGRGVLGGGFNGVSPNNHNVISYVEVQSGGIFKDFGDLTLVRSYFPAGQTSSSTRGIFAGGYGGGGGYNTIDFITIANTGNAIDFGDISVAKFGQGGLSNQTRALFGGNSTAPFDNIIEFVTIATTGNAQDFGDLVKQRGLTAGASSSTRGVFTGGRSNTPSSNAQDNIMEYVTIATTGNTQDFGDLSTTTRYGHTGFSSPTRGISAGGFDPSGQAKTIDYFTIATLGNSSDFGDLSAVTGYCGSVTNSTRGAVTINNQPNYYNTLEFITIATLGDAQDYGDADVGSSKGHGDFPACASDSHGGVA